MDALVSDREEDSRSVRHRVVVQVDACDKAPARLAQTGTETGDLCPVLPHQQAAYADHDVALAEGPPSTERLAARFPGLSPGSLLDADTTPAGLS